MKSGELNSQVEETLKGSFDLHVHAGPDPAQERRLDALETARYAHEAEMAGFVLKSHQFSTAPLALALDRIYPGLKAAGSITLNSQVGGLNPAAVEAAAGIGARVVWMPTFDAYFYRKGLGQDAGIALTDESGVLLPAVHDIIAIAGEHAMVLASGHVSPAEALELFKACKNNGVERLVATHPAGIASEEELAEMALLGAYIELTFLSCMPSVGKATPAELASLARSLGVGRCVVTTDFGQWMNPPPAEGMRMAIASLLDAGMATEEVAALVKVNPLQLVGLDG